MATRFDEMELESVPLIEQEPVRPNAVAINKRAAILLVDVSLVAALYVAMMPLLPSNPPWWVGAALAGFVVVVSFYYFAGSWLLWGRTVGGAIFDVKVVPASGSAMTLRAAALRWVGVVLSILTCGIGFLFGLADRLSKTRSTT